MNTLRLEIINYAQLKTWLKLAPLKWRWMTCVWGGGVTHAAIPPRLRVRLVAPVARRRIADERHQTPPLGAAIGRGGVGRRTLGHRRQSGRLRQRRHDVNRLDELVGPDAAIGAAGHVQQHGDAQRVLEQRLLAPRVVLSCTSTQVHVTSTCVNWIKATSWGRRAIQIDFMRVAGCTIFIS